jgi:hypothetical protein
VEGKNRYTNRSATHGQPEWRKSGSLIRPPGAKIEAQKEFLKATLMRGRTADLEWDRLVRDYFIARAQEAKEGKMKWCLPDGVGEPPPKEVLFRTAKDLALALGRSQEVPNKIKRLVARISLCQDKPDLLAAVARFFPRLTQGTQRAINRCEEQWQAWNIQSLRQLFLLTKIFYEAQEQTKEEHHE